MKVEIRVPTYKRPGLLRRALESLMAQTHTDWVARVFDDSPTREGEAVCKSLNDPRIMYEPNSVNLGICQNLDRSFSIKPLAGSFFLAVLEDDNYYLAECLSKNIEALNTRSYDIILRNQLIEQMNQRDAPGSLSTRTTYDGQYQNGPLSHIDLFISFFYCSAANNSSLFWRANAGLDFSTIRYLPDVVSQERLRTLCIDRDVLIGFEPLIVWRDNGDETLRPKLDSRLKWRVSQLRSAADERAIYQALYRYLESITNADRIYERLVDFPSNKERVFWRVGLHLPHRFRRLSAKARTSISAKRTLAVLGTSILQYAPEITIDAIQGRLA